MKNSINLLKIATFLAIFFAFNACKKDCVDGQNTDSDNKSNVKYFITSTGSVDYSAFKFDFFFAKYKELTTNGDTIVKDLDIPYRSFNHQTVIIPGNDSLGIGTFAQNQINQFELKISNAKVSKFSPQTNEYSLGQTQSVVLPIIIEPKDNLDYEVTFEINVDESVVELSNGDLKFEPKIKVIVVEK
jgi:hypothetical protein